MKKILFILSVLWAGFMSAQSVTVIQPNGGEVLYACQTYTVKWSQTGSPSDYWNIDYSLDGGTIWTSVASNYLSTNGQFVWTVPNVFSNTVLMRVKDALNATTVDQSDALFSINIPITVTSPNGGEVWTSGTVHNITWNSVGTTNLYTIRYSLNNGVSWTAIVSSYSTTAGTYAWTIPFTPTTTCLVQVYDATASCTKDQSDAMFTIDAPTPQLVSPNGGELLDPNCSTNITWNPSTFFSTVNLYYSLNNGSTWTTIATNLSNSGSYAGWVPPVVPTGTTTCLVKAANSASVTLYDISDATFAIKNPVTVVSPNGGENFLGCNTYTINWTKGSTCLGSWNIYYSLDNGSTWTLFVSSLADNASLSQGYVWNLPETAYSSTVALIKVSPTSYTTSYDVSDATFSMTPSNDVTVLYPNGGEVLTGGTTAVITWSATAATSGTFTIRYFDGSTTTNLTTTATGTSYTWTVPNATPTRTNCTITVRDTYNTCKTDISNATFTVNYVPPGPQLVSPNGGELLDPNCSTNITWNPSTFFSTVNLYYSLNNGSTWTTIATNLSNSGSYAGWVPPVVPTGTTTCLVKAANSASVTLYDISDATFAIKNPVTVVSPNGGENFLGCNTYTINWTKGSTCLGSWNIYYSLDNGSTWTLFVSSLADNASLSQGYVWNLPETAYSSTVALIKVSPTSYTTSYDVSDATFSMTPSNDVTVLYPNGGEVLTGGTTAVITWSATAATSGTFTIRYFDGSTTTNLTTTATGTSYTWTVPNATPTRTNCTITVRDTYNTCKTDISNATFTVNYVPPGPQLVSPNGGELLDPNCSTNITWNPSTFFSTVNLYYSLNNGSTWTTIATNLSNSGSYAGWVPPVVPTGTTTCLVKAANSASVTLYDISDATFAIKNPVTVVSPNGGENFLGCNTYTINWTKGSTCLGSWNIYYSLDNGSTWTLFVSSLADNASLSQGYVWNLPETAYSSTVALIKVSPTSYTTSYDVSDATFSMTPSNDVTVLYPNGGEVLTGGTTAVITWSATAATSGTFTIRYFDGSTTTNLTTTATGTSYTWTVPNATPTRTNCTITVRDTYNTCKTDISNATFTVNYVPPGPQLVSPNGGELLDPNCSTNITWNPSTFFSTVNLYYSLNNGSTWTTIATNLSNSGSYAGWVPPVVPTGTTTCLVKAANSASVTLYDISDATFAIKNPVTVVSPNGGENFLGCNTYTINWTKGSTCLGSWNIYYSLDNGSTWTLFVSSLADNASLSQGYVWNLPETAYSSTVALIKVSPTSYTTSYDVSDATFSMTPSNDVTVLYPNGGEVLTGGTTAVITWSATAATSGTFTIRYFDGSTTTNLTTTATGTSYTWTVPNATPTRTNCTITVRDTYNTCKTDISNATFTVNYVPPGPQLVSPNGGELLDPNCSTNITWNPSTFFSTVNLYYSLNNGSTWTTIATNLSNSGSYAGWVPPVVPTGTTTCLVKAANSASVTLYDISDATFAIKNPVTVVSPNGGENFLGCNTYTINWTKGSTCLGSWNIYYSLDNGSTWTLFVSSLADNASLSQSYAWSLPETAYSSTVALIKVSPTSFATSYDVSDATFSMTPSDDVTVLYPNGGEVLTGGTTAVITWSATAATSGTYTIRYFDGSTTTNLTTTATGTSYTWTVPNATPTRTNCTITIRDTYNTCKTDISNATFTVNYIPPIAQLLTPNGGESLYSGTNYNITWYTPSFFSTINLYYSLNNGSTWTTIATNLTNNGVYNWTLPVGTSTTCLVKAANYADVTVYDVSDAVFTIKPPCTILTPNGDNGVTVWGGCTVTSITFDHSPAWTNYKLEYSINGGANWNTIIASYAVSGNPSTYNWNIPNNATSQALVRVSPVSVAYTDQSDNTFTITKPVTIIQPNFGGIMQSGTVYPIKWTSDGISNIYDIFYSINGGTTYSTVVIGYNTSINTYSWTVPATVSNNCKIIVRDNISTCKTDTSDQAFIIQAGAPAITLLNPNGGDTLRGCSTYTINWTDAVPNGSYNLAYSTNSGSSWISIVNNYTTTVDNYNWVVPNTVNSNNVLVRVQSATTLTTLDLSDALLSIKNGTLIATPSTTAICSGNSVQLNASGGINYAWTPSGSLNSASISNPIATPTTSTIYTVQSVNGSCILSNTVNIAVSGAGAPANVTITASPSNSICPGATVTFSTAIANGGSSPTYQWILNGVGVGTSTPTYSSNTLSNNDVVQCLITSNLSCVSNNPALSNSITMNIVSGQTPSVTLNASPSNTICPGTLVTFSATPAYGGTAPTYVWKLNGATVGGSTATYTNNTLANGNTVTVIMTSNAGCLITTTATSGPMAITVNTTPAVPSAINGSTLVCANAAYTYTAAAVSGATTYNWTLPGGWSGSSTSNTIAVTTATNGGVITVQAANACGTSSSRILSVSVGSPTVSITGASSLCTGSNITLTAGGATSYTWSTSQTTTSISVSPTITTTYSLTGADAGGCMATTTKTVTVNGLPVVSATSPTICGGSTATVTASGASTYTWNTTATGATLVVTPTVTTNYTVTGTSAAGCVNTATTSVTVGAAPSISVNTATICTGSSATLTASGVTTYTWNTSSNATSIVVTPTATTVYTVNGNLSGCTSVATKTTMVTVNPLPTVSITASSSSICAGQSVNLTVSGSVTSYTWNTSQTTNSISVSPTITTTYSIIGVNSNGCQNTASKIITFNALPVVSATSPTICGGSTATVTASGASTYTWNTTATGANLIVTPATTTNYTVTGTSTAGCINTATTSVTVGATPSISVNAATVCAGSSATLTASGVTTYTWNTSSNAASIVVTPTATTVYTVSGNLSGCTTVATKTTTVMVNTLPTVSITASSSSICAGQSSNLTVSGSVTSYTWNTSQTTNSISVTPTTTTTYSIIGIDGNGCQNSASKVITVNALPVVSATSPTICGGATATVTASGASTYTWDTGANGQDLVVTPSGNTNYIVTGTSAAGCVNTATTSVVVGPAPSISVNAATVCAGSSATLTATGVTTYTWSTSETTASIVVSPTSTTVYTVSGNDPGCTVTASNMSTVNVNALPTLTVTATNASFCVGGSTDLSVSGSATSYTWSTMETTSTITVTPVSTTTYSITGEDGNGCQNTTTSMITVNPLPTINVPNSTICTGGTTTLSASGATTYTWNTGANGQDLVVSPTVNTDYTVTGTSAFGCVNTATASVTITSAPTISVNSEVICSGNSVVLTASGVSTYTWSTGENTTTISVNPSSTSEYTVNGDAVGCAVTVSQTATVTVNTSPMVSAVSSNTLLCSGETATLSASGANTYTWSTTETTPDIAVTPSSTVDYTVTGEGSNGCTNSVIVTQSVSLCTDLATNISTDVALNVYPNPFRSSFTISYPSMDGVEISVTDVLGKVIYTTKLTEEKTEIDLLDQASGIYFIRLNTKHGIITKKLIKE